MAKKSTAKEAEVTKAEATAAAPDAENAPKPKAAKRKAVKAETKAEARGPIATPTQAPPILKEMEPEEKPATPNRRKDRYDEAMRILDEYYEGTPPREPGHYHDED